MKNKCPHCNKTNCIDDVVYLNCEQYGEWGESYYTIPCVHCKKIIDVIIDVVPKVISVEKSNKKLEEADF